MNQEITKLERKIKKASEYYYSGNPIMPDTEFDSLLEQLQKENPNSKLLTTGWGTKDNNNKQITHNPSAFPKMHRYKIHEIPKKVLKSLQNIVILTPKYDGIGIINYYNKENPISTTRGNGITGGITQFPTIQNKTNSEFIRCEYIIPTSNKHIWPDKNLRNILAGLIHKQNKLENSIIDNVDKKPLFDEKSINSTKQLNLFLETYQMPSKIVKSNLSKQTLLDYYKECKQTLPYEIDGLVLYSNNNNPIIIKFIENKVPSKILKIEYSIGKKTGKITPIAYIEPVRIDNRLISKASLGSIKQMKLKQLEKGKQVYVYLANKIIPQLEVIPGTPRKKAPTTFPGIVA